MCVLVHCTRYSPGPMPGPFTLRGNPVADTSWSVVMSVVMRKAVLLNVDFTPLLWSHTTLRGRNLQLNIDKCKYKPFWQGEKHTFFNFFFFTHQKCPLKILLPPKTKKAHFFWVGGATHPLILNRGQTLKPFPQLYRWLLTLAKASSDLLWCLWEFMRCL